MQRAVDSASNTVLAKMPATVSQNCLLFAASRIRTCGLTTRLLATGRGCWASSGAGSSKAMASRRFISSLSACGFLHDVPQAAPEQPDRDTIQFTLVFVVSVTVAVGEGLRGPRDRQKRSRARRSW